MHNQQSSRTRTRHPRNPGRSLALSLVCLFLFLFACGGVSPPNPHVPNEDDAAAQCADICVHMAELRCDGWQGNAGPDEVTGTSDDATCELACVDIQTIVALDARCLTSAPSCQAVNACEAL